ncbi:hypothetical protein APHAL10511_004492 [Amanita phalloides]|nr:hypothetical protein APHAL10511_004492 [Amanita phalloides]
MSNLLLVPRKPTTPLSLAQPVRQYIHHCAAANPDQFKHDIDRWQALRKNALTNTVHALLKYHAQLSSVLSKLPVDIQLDIAYAPAFAPGDVFITLKNLEYERAAVLFNLAALYCSLAMSEDRAHMEGIKRATVNFQLAAGTFSFLLSSAIPKLVLPPDTDQVPLDLSEPFVKSLERLMLAQAQECSWQMAKLNQYKNGVIARVAAQTAAFYRQAYETIRDSDKSIGRAFPSDWLPHIEAKWHHFDSVSQYRQSMDDIEARRYGHELARLGQARQDAKAASDAGRRGEIAHAVLQDVQSLLDTLQRSLTRAERDNDLIYHHDVPAVSSLPPIKPAPLVSTTVPPGLANSAVVLGNEPPLFANLLSWGVREAINIYNEQKKSLLQEKLVGKSQQLQLRADQALSESNLPASLEALERHIGLPPSLLKRAEEVRIANGPANIEASIGDIQKLAHRDLELLDEAMDILDSEASEDEAARKNGPLNRLPSHEANVKLVEKQKRYRDILTQASESDGHVRQKWEGWEQSIVALTWSEEDLEASVPQSTFAASSPSTSQGKKTQALARALHVLLESLDDLHRNRDQMVKRAKRLADADDISDCVIKEASKFGKMADIRPVMFSEVSDQELAKYDKFLVELRDYEEKQNAILAEIKAQNESFLQSRRDDPAVKNREFALQSLELSYFKFKEISRNLEEGYKFYNDLAGLLINFKEECRMWTQERRHEVHLLTREMRSLAVRDTEKCTRTSAAAPEQRTTVNFPPIYSSEWEFEAHLPAGPKSRRQ